MYKRSFRNQDSNRVPPHNLSVFFEDFVMNCGFSGGHAGGMTFLSFFQRLITINLLHLCDPSRRQ